MAHQYTDAEAQAVFGKDMSEVWPYYRDLAERQRPAVQRSAARLQGQPAPEPAPDSVFDDADEDVGEGGDPDPEPGEEAAGLDEVDG